MKVLIFICSLYGAAAALAIPTPYDPTQYRVVPDSEVVEQLNPSGQVPMSSNLNILVWNVHKATGLEQWRMDLNQLAQGRSLALIQEGMQDDYMPKALSSVPSFGWTMGKTFYMNIDRNATGVITGAVQDPVSSRFLRSRDLEPLIKTPKITLLTAYEMEDHSQILVANIHAINFQKPEPFYRQIDDLIAVMKNWNGKIIFAGDFNTWIPVRTQYLIDQAKSIGLQHLTFAVDPRPQQKVLDHIFVRGCQVVDAKVHTEITSSDHSPLTADLNCGN